LRPILLPLLWALSLIFRAAVGCRALYYRLGLGKRTRLPGKTWSIGNIAVGGTGKSPVTMAMAQLLLGRGARPAILTRGYGAPIKSGDCLVLRSGQVVRPASNTTLIPDEARMQSAKLPEVPVIAGPDRVRAAAIFLREFPNYQPTHWLLDDGFQHLRLERDLDIVLLDASHPLPALLPLGLARESAQGLRRADLVIFTRSSETAPSAMQVTKVQSQVRRGTPILKTRMITSAPTVSVSGQVPFDPQLHTPAALVSGIAAPQQLRDAVASLGLKIGESLSLKDHQPIPKEALIKLAVSHRSLFTTAKDYWRDPAIFKDTGVPVFILELELSWGQTHLNQILQDYI